MDTERKFDEVADFLGCAGLFWKDFDGELRGYVGAFTHEDFPKTAKATAGMPVIENDPKVGAFVAAVLDDGV